MNSLLRNIEKTAIRFSYVNILDEIRHLKTFENEENQLDLVVLGQFKAGKSSLLNSLIGRKLLPVGVLPVTAIITRMAFGEYEKVIVTTLSNEQMEIGLDELPLFITEKENPENKKGVYLVDIFVRELANYKNIRFIDTPGLGSAFKHNTKVTQNWFSRIGAAIVVINAGQAYSDNDRQLTESALEQSPEVYFILSKTDLIHERELQEVKQFVKQKSLENFKKELPVFTYSVEKNTKSCRQSIEQKLLQHLNSHHVLAKEQIFKHKQRHLQQLTISYLSISLSVRQKEQAERNELKDKIIDEQLKLNYIKQELHFIAQNYLDTTRTALESEIVDKNQSRMIRILTNDFENAFAGWQGNLSKLSRQYEDWIKKSMIEHLSSFEKELRPFSNALSEKAAKHFNNYCQLFRERLNHNLEKILGISMPDDDFKVKIDQVKKPDIMVSWAFESHIDLLWFLIPMFLFRNYFHNYFKKQLPAEVEKNLHRLVSQLSTKINHSIEQTHREGLEYITNQLQTIEQLLSEKSNDSNEVQQYINLLKE